MASSEGLGLKAMMIDFGLNTTPHLFVDASAAIGICQRKGLGKIRHLDTQSLWIQDALREKRLSINKVPGTENPSDAMTKFLDGVCLTKMLDLMNCNFLEGRPDSAPQLATDADTNLLDQAPQRAPTLPAPPAPTRQQQDAIAAAAAAGQQRHSIRNNNNSSSSNNKYGSFSCCFGDWRAWQATGHAKKGLGVWADEQYADGP